LSYTDSEVLAVLNSRTLIPQISFQYDLLNKYDIKIGDIDGLEDAQISFNMLASIKRIAKIKLTEYLTNNIDYTSDRIQPYFRLRMPDGGTAKYPLGIFLLSSPTRKTKGKLKQRDVVCYDKSLILEEDCFTSSYYIPAGTNYINAIERIIQTAGITKVNLESSNAVLPNGKEFEAGYTKRKAINDLLNAINYDSLWVDGMGYIRSSPYVLPSDRAINHYYIAGKDSILSPEFTESMDIAGAYNVFTRTYIDMDNSNSIEYTSTFTNDDPLSPLSTVRRGRRIVSVETLESISSQEALDNYVKRIATESTSKYSKISFGTILNPLHNHSDTIYLDVPDILAVPMKFNETSWEMPLKSGAIMTHEARKVVQL